MLHCMKDFLYVVQKKKLERNIFVQTLTKKKVHSDSLVQYKHFLHLTTSSVHYMWCNSKQDRARLNDASTAKQQLFFWFFWNFIARHSFTLRLLKV